ncbi:helix-turn-helix domain-containing protein [Paracoccus sp. AK26]|uniref:helix-turn-helix domain-containing protein n=1 Tax=Paracoccus sp. AK26 TaxID=2589076 RepID=UPI001428147F|nr:helix-turn-helix domain-containing protein [Paracoccus sp. AK26]QIR84622.1 helix-turn-helix domain-containing protein [Paracoccus sp. AK26]
MTSYAFMSEQRRPLFVRLAPLRWAETIEGIDGGPMDLLLLLARRSDDYGCCNYSQATLAKQLRRSKRTITNYLRELKHYGLVRTIGRVKGFKRTSSVYHLVAWWPRKLLPPTGHDVYGRFVKEPNENVQRQLAIGQTLLRDKARIASHNKDHQLSNITAEEEILETCIVALGDWASDDDREMLRGAWPTLFELLGEGYSLQAHVLPVLGEKAASRYKPKRIRSWHYFAEALAHYADRHPVVIDEVPVPATTAEPVLASPMKAEEPNSLDEALADLERSRQRAAGTTGEAE